MRYLRKTFLLLALLGLILFVACENTATEAVAETKYDFVINNYTADVYDVYMKTDVSAEGFGKVGVAYSKNHFHYHDLVIDVNYTFRLVPHNGSVDDKKHEKVVKSTNSKTIIWDVN